MSLVDACNSLLYEVREHVDVQLCFELCETESEVQIVLYLLPLEDVNPSELIRHVP